MKRSRKSASHLLGSISDSLGSSPAKKTKGEDISDIESSLHYLRSLFPAGVFDPLTPSPLPPIVLKHQLYSLHPDRTSVDRHIMSLRDAGHVRLLKLGVGEEDYCVLSGGDYSHYLQACLGEGGLARKVTKSLLPSCHDVSVTREKLTELKFKEEEISTLVSKGVLLVRGVGKTSGSWWLAVPGVSPFIKSLTKGRSMLKQMIGRSKFKEILRRDLASRKMTVSKLPMDFHIHDIIGADIVERVETTSGDLLRLVEPSR